MIADIRTLKSGDLLKLNDKLFYKKISINHDGYGELPRGELVIFLGLQQRPHVKSRAYYAKVLHKDRIIYLLVHSVMRGPGLPKDLDDTRYACYSVSRLDDT